MKTVAPMDQTCTYQMILNERVLDILPFLLFQLTSVLDTASKKQHPT